MSSSIERLIKEVRIQRGKKSESRVENALSFLLEKGEINEFLRDEKLDRKGIDFRVRIYSKNYDISVKSSQKGVDWELKEHPKRFRKGNLIFIVPDPNETLEELASRIMKEILEFEERMHSK